MKIMKKAVIIWLCCIAFLVSSVAFIHIDFQPTDFITNSILILLFIFSILISRYEPTSKNRHVFRNFALFFSLGAVYHLRNFIGPVFFQGDGLAKFYFDEYVSQGIFYFLLAFALVYLTLDVLFRDFRTYQKYLAGLVIVGTFYGYYYRNSFTDPKFAYSTLEIAEYKAVDETHKWYRDSLGVEMGPVALADTRELIMNSHGASLAGLSREDRIVRVSAIYPYMAGDNYINLLYRPLYKNSIYMSVVCVGFILLFFGYQYAKDPPQGAYIEKIMFMFLLMCTVEIMHMWAFIHSVEWETLVQFTILGQYISAAILFLVAVFFGLRLRFITSVQGEFYEQEIHTSPQNVTRWRDGVDNLLIRNFFNPKYVIGRMFANSSEKLTSEAQYSPKT